MTRRPLTRTTKAAVLARQKGLCAHCDEPLGKRVEYDHVLPVALGGTNDADNIEALHTHCHRLKTNVDIGRIAKADRQRKAHLGLKAKRGRPLKGRSFCKTWRRRMDGTVERREA